MPPFSSIGTPNLEVQIFNKVPNLRQSSHSFSYAPDFALTLLLSPIGEEEKGEGLEFVLDSAICDPFSAPKCISSRLAVLSGDELLHEVRGCKEDSVSIETGEQRIG